MKSSVIKATCPKQSVVPRPCNLSPSTVSLNGSRSQVSGLAGTTSRWLPINDTVSFASPYIRIITVLIAYVLVSYTVLYIAYI